MKNKFKDNVSDGIKDMSGYWKIIVLVIAVAIIAFRSIYFISEQKNGVVTQFGKVVRVDTAGMHFKAPWQSLQTVDITTHGTGIGYYVKDGQNIASEEDGIMITSDFNLLNIDFYMEYKVSDPVAYLYNSQTPEEILENIALANIRTVVSNYTVDEAMTTAKGLIEQEVKEAMIKSLEDTNIGLSVQNITIQDSEPPTEDIIAAFKAVETAKQGADTAKNNALQYKNEQIPKAEAKADKIVQNATAAKEARIAEATGEASKFNKMYEQYSMYPEITKKRMFFEKVEEILPNTRVIITDGQSKIILNDGTSAKNAAISDEVEGE
ncbi:FtsH protease activity modulator HflK [Pseudobutyrivibrio sp.]|uniref:FtsH protease activity modulator HflK n=1 Tax=Pseudobutyrivibrio sp. TaxID=2014367 RepID=UPI0025D8E303|nr:FtsH protease activity modulator HflK [Pseudobutyrivibrio sp.]